MLVLFINLQMKYAVETTETTLVQSRDEVMFHIATQLEEKDMLKADKIRTGCGSKLCHFGILSADKCRNHCSLCIDCRSVLGSNPEG